LTRNEELGAVCRKVLDEGGPALLFNNVKNYPYPVFTNMLGTQSRIALGMDVTLEEMADVFLARSRTRPWLEPAMRDTAPCRKWLSPKRSCAWKTWCRQPSTTLATVEPS
jgi:UbiD family decarboxylase